MIQPPTHILYYSLSFPHFSYVDAFHLVYISN
jgi:hypothetical protein